MENPEINKAVAQLEESAFSEAQLLGYDHFWDMVSTAKMQISSSRREGLEEGEKKKAMDIARLMKANNEPIDKIIRYTNLSEEEINSL